MVKKTKQPRKKIVIIEDSRELSEALTAIFEAKGFEVASARNGVEGIELAKRHKPNLILLDLMLPKLSGFDVCKILKTDEGIWRARTKIVVMSTLTDPEKIDRAKEMGADHFISKPYNIEEVVAQSLKFIK